MHQLTAISFALAGWGLFMASRNPRVSAGLLGALVSILGLALLFEFLWELNLINGQFFMSAPVWTQSSSPGPITPNMAVCIFLSGLAVTLFNLKVYPKSQFWFPGLLGAMVSIVGLLALAGHWISIDPTYGWGRFTYMAVHTSLGFVVLGLGVMSLSYYGVKQDHHFTCCPPLMVGAIGFMGSGLLWLTLVNGEEIRVRQEVADKLDEIENRISSQWAVREQAMAQWAQRGSKQKTLLKKEWVKEAENPMSRFPGIRALGWMDPQSRFRWAVPESQMNFIQNRFSTLETHVQKTLDAAIAQKTLKHSKFLNDPQKGKAVLSVAPLFGNESYRG
ncbi:MAG: hypothetical protein GWN10_18075, partial [Nitrospinaceae bacterium]|nr:hypothetical protein [Nitrospinaceae bacterium]NIW07500.1 hypothetical protein [Nitrospinaceae bacterium]NIX36088.1 hypothetical protein [Nitrospinaceae bacterium]